MKQNINAAAANIADTLEELAYQAGEIADALAILETGLYYASEREDRDLTKPGAAAALILGERVKRLQGDILELQNIVSA